MAKVQKATPKKEPPPDPRPEAVRSALRQGIEKLDQKDPGAALLWFVEALKADLDPARQRVHRLRIALLLQEMPKLRPIVAAAGEPARSFVVDKVADPPTTMDAMDPLIGANYKDHALLSPDGRRLAVWNRYGPKGAGKPQWHLQLFDSENGKPIGPVLDLGRPVPPNWVAFSPDGQRLAVFTCDESLSGPAKDAIIRVWNVDAGKAIGPVIRLSDPPVVDKIKKLLEAPVSGWDLRNPGQWFRLGFSPDGRWVVAENTNDGPHLGAWDVHTGEPLSLAEPFNQLFFSADGRLLLTSWNKQVERRINVDARVWDSRTGKPIGEPIRVSDVRAACFSPDGRHVLIAHSYWIGVWDVQTGQRTHERLLVPRLVLQVAFSPDGLRFAAGSIDWAQVWDARTGDVVTPRIPLSSVCKQLHFTADGRCLLTVTEKDARLWDASTGEPLTPAIMGEGGWMQIDQLFSAVLSPDGRTVFARLRKDTSQYEIRQLVPEERPVEDLERLAQALSGRRIDASGKLSALPPAELQTLCRNMLLRFPEQFGPPIGRPEDALTQRPDPRVPRLVRILLDASEPIRSRQLAAQRLGELRARAALSDLETALAKDKDQWVRVRAATALGDIGQADSMAVPALVNAIQKDSSGSVRTYAIQAMEKGAARHAIPVLTQALKKDADPFVRAAAARALRFMRPGDAEAFQALQTALKDKERRVRVQAAGTMAQLTPDAPEPIAVLVALLQDTKDKSDVLQTAAEYVGNIGPRAKDAAPALIVLAKQYQGRSGSEDESWHAVRALGKIGPDARAAIPTLIAKLHLNEPDPHNSVALALARIGPAAIPDLLRTFKESKDAKQRRAAVVALGYLGPAAKEVVPELESALKKPREQEDSEWLELALRQALSDIRNPMATPPTEIKD